MEKQAKLFETDLQVINIGLDRFNEAVKDQGRNSIQVDWRPPAGGNQRLQEILEKLNS